MVPEAQGVEYRCLHRKTVAADSHPRPRAHRRFPGRPPYRPRRLRLPNHGDVDDGGDGGGDVSDDDAYGSDGDGAADHHPWTCTATRRWEVRSDGRKKTIWTLSR